MAGGLGKPFDLLRRAFGSRGSIRLRITGLLTAVIALCAILAVIAGSLMELSTHKTLAQKNVLGVSRVLADVMKPVLTGEIDHRDRSALRAVEHLLGSVVRGDRVLSVKVVDSAGNAVLTSGPDKTVVVAGGPVTTALGRPWKNQDPEFIQTGGVVEASYPVQSEGSVIGAVLFTFKTRSIAEIVIPIVGRNAAIAAVMILLAMLLSITQVNRIVQPIRSLTRAANRIAQGELDTPINTSAPGEVGVLASAFRRMISTVGENVSEIQTLAFQDAVTGLHNRKSFSMECERIIDRRENGEIDGAMLFIDLDEFKRVNDIYGHDAGDRLLRAVSTRMSRLIGDCFPPQTSGYSKNGLVNGAGDPHAHFEPPRLARLGGDEFGLLLPSIRWEKEPEAIAEMLLGTLRTPMEIGSHEVTIGASIGIARFPMHGQTYEKVLKSADLAMYHAKRAGRNCCAVYHRGMDRRLNERIEVEDNLRQAIDGDQFEVHFQPKVTCEDGNPAGVEVFPRWNHPVFGRISPNRFIPIAEELGLVNEIGEWVLTQACQTAASWIAGGTGQPISVNFSMRQIERPNFPERVLDILQESGLPGDMLEIEISESAAMTDPETIIRQLEPLRAHGIRLAIDDFGAGNSNLAVLKRLPLDSLKIDRSLITDLPADSGAIQVVEALIGMARKLNLDVVAEGVEHREQVAILAELGCRLAQGHCIARPMPLAEYRDWLRDALSGNALAKGVSKKDGPLRLVPRRAG